MEQLQSILTDLENKANYICTLLPTFKIANYGRRNNV